MNGVVPLAELLAEISVQLKRLGGEFEYIEGDIWRVASSSSDPARSPERGLQVFDLAVQKIFNLSEFLLALSSERSLELSVEAGGALAVLNLEELRSVLSLEPPRDSVGVSVESGAVDLF